MRAMINITIICIATLLAGCETTTPSYADWTVNSLRNTPDRATLKCLPHVQVVAFDGDKKKRMMPRDAFGMATCLIVISPGPHTILLRYNFVFSRGRIIETIRAISNPIHFVAKPGGQYLLRSIGSDKVTGKALFSIVPINAEE
ncbi:MAG: hypothetical protein ABUS47_11150 [Steroidobacter sp.]